MSQFRNSLGAQPPLGFWDPLGLLKDADQERFDRLRYVELKHGRISMLAVLGHLVTTSGSRLPGDIAFGVPFASMKNGLAVFETLPVLGLVQIVCINYFMSPSYYIPHCQCFALFIIIDSFYWPFRKRLFYSRTGYC